MTAISNADSLHWKCEHRNQTVHPREHFLVGNCRPRAKHACNLSVAIAQLCTNLQMLGVIVFLHKPEKPSPQCVCMLLDYLGWSSLDGRWLVSFGIPLTDHGGPRVGIKDIVSFTARSSPKCTIPS